MENVWGMWLFFYIPAFLCGCAVGGAAMFALAKKIIAAQARQIVLAKRPVTLRTTSFRKAC